MCFGRSVFQVLKTFRVPASADKWKARMLMELRCKQHPLGYIWPCSYDCCVFSCLQNYNYGILTCTSTYIKLKQTKGWKVTNEIMPTVIWRKVSKCIWASNGSLSKFIKSYCHNEWYFCFQKISSSRRDIYRMCQIFARCGMSNIYFVHIAMRDCKAQYWHFWRRAEFIQLPLHDETTRQKESLLVMWCQGNFILLRCKFSQNTVF